MVMDGKKVFMLLTNPFKPDPRVYKEAKTLIELGFDVTVVAWDRERNHKLFEIVEGVRVCRIPIASKYASFFDFFIKLPLFYLKAVLYVVKNKDGLYAIHANDFDTAPLAFFLSRLLGVKFIYDIHDLYHSRISLLREKKTLNFLQRLILSLEIIHAKLADSVITVTRSLGGRHKGVKEFLVNRGVVPDKVYVVWNTPELEFFPLIKRERGEKFTVGYIGTIRSVSSFIPLFEVARRDRRLKLLFVGSGASKGKIANLLTERYPNVDVEFIDEVPYHNVFKYYTLCDAVYSMYPPTDNIKRALAVKMFESIVMGIPVIVNRDTLMEDFVVLYRCGVSSNLSTEDMANALEKIIKVKPPSRLRDKWNWDRNRSTLRRVYCE
ncbi:glycosyltransferase family 4 protein [Thermococcus gammatolerans]|nr:glycosyltransferase family 4 protein [Thermococcus gammatolerans]